MGAPAENGATAAPVLVRHRVVEVVAHAFGSVLAYDTRVEDASDDVIHEVRASVRELRYVLELFRDVLPPQASRLIAELRAVQARLGRLHDHGVAAARARKWLERGKVEPTPELVAWIKEQERLRVRERVGFVREWRALRGGFQRHLLRLLAMS